MAKAATTTAPYWGNLDPPAVSVANTDRRSSLDGPSNARYSSHIPVPSNQQGPQRRSTTGGARTSTHSQATASTQSSYVSPIRSSFHQGGLAPRPPSFPYDLGPPPDKEFADRRSQRARREAEESYRGDERSYPPPAAPEAPISAPPPAFKQAQNSTAYQVPGRSRSTRETGVPGAGPEPYGDGRRRSVDDRQRSNTENQKPSRGYQQQRSSISGDDRRKDYPDRAGSRKVTVGARNNRPEIPDRRSSVADSEAQRRREWAPDRSPLQRLELTLDSITKEEKRARVEEAELLAREAKAGRGGERATQNSVRNRNRPITNVPEPSTQPEPQTLPEAGLVRSLSNRQKDELQRSGTVEKRRPVDTRPTQTKSSGKGFEYQPQQSPDDRPQPQPERVVIRQNPEKAAVLEKEPSPTARRKSITKSAGPAIVAAGLSRSDSNKLKKEPPGDPWYRLRQQAEEKYPEVTVRRPSVDTNRPANTMTGVAPVSPPVALASRPLHPDIRGNGPMVQEAPQAPRQAAQSTRKDAPVVASSSRQSPRPSAPQPTRSPILPQQQQLYADRLDRSEELGPSGIDRHDKTQTEIKTINGRTYAVAPEVGTGNYGQELAARGPDGHHHFAHINPVHQHHRRSMYRPGDGLYVADRPLSEWKTAQVGLLSGTLLDLDAKQTEAEEHKAWWETNSRDRRRPSASRPKNVDNENQDTQRESSNGMVPPSLFSDFTGGDDVRFITSGNRTWSRVVDPVVAPARLNLGSEDTKTATIRRLPRWLSNLTPQESKKQPHIRAARVARARAKASDKKRSIFPSIFPIYDLNCPKISKHNIYHPFHVCPHSSFSRGVQKRLTPTMRLIRVPTSAPTYFNPPLYLKCGPLLRYCGIRKAAKATRLGPSSVVQPMDIWRGSVMIVTTDSESNYDTPPTLRLFVQPMDLLPPPPAQVDGEAGELAPEYVDPIAGLPKIARDGKTLYVRPVEELDEGKDFSKEEGDEGLFESSKSIPTSGPNQQTNPKGKQPSQKNPLDGEKLGKYIEIPAFRLHAEKGTTFWRFNLEIELRPHQQRIAYRINKGPATGFWVPAQGQAMNIMFHSCNGFSLSVNPDQFSGPDPMWRDVLNTHQTSPSHVMIGGGDQIYNDSVMKNSPMFSTWLGIKNPLEKHNAPLSREMQDELESFYLERYATWFSQGLFGLANSQIPMVNVWDDHDIIDGFGSYPHSFMDTPVFAGLGAIAFKYYMLFQHQSVVDEGEATEPSWMLGTRPGPYIKELSRSVLMHMGGQVAFLGLDCRTERTQDCVVTDETCDKIFDRLHDELVKGETKHLLVLLGIPIAYPRLVWLENILTSRLMDPIKALGKAAMFGNLISQLDGGVEVLDDLNDHWTAKNHKHERKNLILDLQELAAAKSIRITILSGDVHLAAIGRFYSNPKLGIPKDHDHRYMANIISSAIVNTPPPSALADIVNKRNRIHHLDDETDEDMVPIFETDVTQAKRNNKRLMPRRNWCLIREYNPELTPPPTPSPERSPSPPHRGGLLRRLSSTTRGPSWRGDAARRDNVSRPPVSQGITRFQSVRGRQSTDGEERPSIRQRAASLGRDFMPGNILRRLSTSRRRHDDGGINGYGSEDDQPYEDDPPPQQRQRPQMHGGAGEPEGYFPPSDTGASVSRSRPAATRGHDQDDGYTSYDETPDSERYTSTRTAPAPPAVPPKSQQADPPTRRPLLRTPTGMSQKQLKRLGGSAEVNMEGSLDIMLNVEISQWEPAGNTFPYRILVPQLWYDDPRERDREPKRKESMMQRVMSIGRRKTVDKGKRREENGGEAESLGGR